jgi:hypothetical protein
MRWVLLAVLWGTVSCQSGTSGEGLDSISPDQRALDLVEEHVPEELWTDHRGPECLVPSSFTVMTFNAGTTDSMNHDIDEVNGGGDGYTAAMAEVNAREYSNNLAWGPAERAIAQFIAQRRPEIAGFQETFADVWCEEVHVDPLLDFACRDYHLGRRDQVARICGEDYQVACTESHRDNCVCVRKDFGHILGCDADYCPAGLAGLPPPSGCTKGARVGTIQIERCDGSLITVVNVHAIASLTEKNMACRVDQFKQIFQDRGDGVPAAHGDVNIVFGDMNMDPFLFIPDDPSAVYWNQWVGEGRPFRYLSADSAGGTPTHVTTMRIDHVISDVLRGHCEVPGETPGVSPVMDSMYFDHRPVVCTVE